MPDLSYFAWRFRCLKWLRASLFGAAALSLASAASLAFRPRATIELLGTGPPGGPFYLWLPAALFAGLGILYLLASRGIRRFSPIIAVAIVTHLALAWIFFVAARGPGAQNLVRLAGADLLIGLSLLMFWWPIRT